jgi:SAM-dependent methyltransferase
MTTSPQARDLEFRQLFLRSLPGRAEKILDVPRLGGYLARACPDLGPVLCLDFAPPVHAGVQQVDPLGPWPVPKADRLVSLAALHHLEDLEGFLANACRHLLPGARIHLGDVAAGSPIAGFLDDFVGLHTPTGHRGFYRTFHTLLYPAPLRLLHVEERPCPWRFACEAEMVAFCRRLFYLQEVSDAAILAALRQRIGVEHRGGAVWLRWHLTYVDLGLES